MIIWCLRIGQFLVVSGQHGPPILIPFNVHTKKYYFKIFTIKNNHQIYKQSPSDSHTKSVTDMDALSTLEVFVTVAAGDYFMKLWDNKNVLLSKSFINISGISTRDHIITQPGPLLDKPL